MSQMTNLSLVVSSKKSGGKEMADLSDNPSSSHGQAGSMIEAVDHGEDVGMPDVMRQIVKELESLEMGRKIERFPSSLPRLPGMEKAKGVSGYTLTRDLDKSREEMYSPVIVEGKDMPDLPDNPPSSSHGQAGSMMKVVYHGEDVEMADANAIHKLVKEFEKESLEIDMKIHRFPAILADMGDQFVIPMALAIGPYHHGLSRLQGMEKAKRVAAYTLTRDSGKSYKEMYARLLAVADQARRLYDEDAVFDISKSKFADMMFHDACFLLQYMQLFSSEEDVIEQSPLHRFFLSNAACIDNDIMLLENQMPWSVIQALITDTKVVVDDFIAHVFFSSSDYNNIAPSDLPPHLLGLLRLLKHGRLGKTPDVLPYAPPSPIRAMELERIGIKLDHSETGAFTDIGFSKGFLFDKLFLPPLIMSRTRASWLANMVAFEVCTGSENKGNAYICSYVAIFAMLMVREEDVHKLRSKGFIEGELSDKQILEFFKRLTQQMTPGHDYFKILFAIGDCKRRRWLRIMVWKFVSDNAKAIAVVLSIIGVLVGIFKALFSLKQH
ncbi:hypothetical protein CFC21_086355 [Triticum aestivum]|uniref:Uncharacterized protein n=2 Tax=Triticum aestivum TaxID=4565 RepID=A0A3B6PEB4_WHEAT|nr:hypothetical protein CFC21_086355 [Triticum aestivum]